MGRLVSNQGGEEQERRHPPSPWFLTQGSMKDPEPLRNDNSKATYGETESSQNSRQGRKHWMKAERCLGRSWNVGTDPDRTALKPTPPVCITPSALVQASPFKLRKCQEGVQNRKNGPKRPFSGQQKTRKRTIFTPPEAPRDCHLLVLFCHIKNQTPDSRTLVVRGREEWMDSALNSDETVPRFVAHGKM